MKMDSDQLVSQILPVSKY